MAGKVFVITSGKGGVGKSTNTANLGTGLAMKGRKVCVVDADIGLRNLDMILGLENRIVYDLVNVIERKCKISQALIRDKRHKNLFLLPAAQTRSKESVTAEQMLELTEKLRKVFDYVLIDCPAGIEVGFRNAVIGADMALLITTPEVSAVRDVDRVIGLLEASGKRHPKLIINRVNNGLSEQAKAQIASQNLELAGLIPEDPLIAEYDSQGRPTYQLPANSPALQAAYEIFAKLLA